MKILVFDTETTGFLQEHLPLEEPSQPWPVQIAAGFFDIEGKPQGEVNMLVNPRCPISYGAMTVHGITEKRAAEFGLKPVTALSMFAGMARQADVVVAHNIKFDQQIILAGIYRTWSTASANDCFFGKQLLCTQEMSASICNLPATVRMKATGFGDKPKAPKLEEAYDFFFGRKFENAHNGRADMMACAEIFFEILRREGVEKYIPTQVAA